MKIVSNQKGTLREIRILSGLSVKEAAKKVGVCDSTLRHWEKFKSFPDAKQISMIEKAYGVHYDQIIFLP